jgi:uncharacterized protein (DUF1501 family)
MKTSRRQLLRVGLGALPVISLSGSVPMFVSKFAMAQSMAPGSDVSNDNILVVVQLSGGNDGLNTIIPARADEYFKARPGIGIKDRALEINDELKFNPGLMPFKEMFDAGQLAIINGCGYPEPNRSHFQSMAIWHTADPTGGAHGGWLGHYLDHCCRGTAAGSLSAVNIGNELPQALVNDGPPVPTIQTVEDFQLKTDPAAPNLAKREAQIIKELNAVRTATPALQFLSRQATNAIVGAEQIRKLTEGYKPDSDYPGGLGQQLKLIAQIIAGEFGTKVFYCQIGGFDTHSSQPGQHENLLRQFSLSVQAFLKDLKGKGCQNKVTVMAFSEFGRRVEQNNSGGTDHGTAGPMFIAGGRVKGGVYGKYPSLAKLDNGDLKYTTDFRRVYSTLLSRWLNADPSAVLKSNFEPVAFLKGMRDTANPTTAPEDSGSGEEDESMMMMGGTKKK